MGNNILLSICVPTYNRETHIQRLVNYFIEEIDGYYKDSQIEVIISNNASTDGTRIYLDQITGKYKWLKIYHNDKNIGAYANFTKLLHLAVGKYWWMPGDDDYLKKGLVRKVVKILEDTSLSYLYLTRRSYDETKQKIELEGKTHDVEYDKPIKVEHKQIVSLLKENFGDLKFQTSSIFLRTNALKYAEEAKCMSFDTQADCHSMFKAVRSMQDGKAYFLSDVSVLNGLNISWGSSMIHYTMECDIEFAYCLSSFGFSKAECKKIANRQLAASIMGFIVKPELFKQWRKNSYVGFKLEQLSDMPYLLFRKVARKFGWSKKYSTVNVDFSDFKVPVCH